MILVDVNGAREEFLGAHDFSVTGFAPAGKTACPEKFPAHAIKSTLLACRTIHTIILTIVQMFESIFRYAVVTHKDKDFPYPCHVNFIF